MRVIFSLLLLVASALAQASFSDTFSTGVLNPALWVIDTGMAPGNISGVNISSFNAAYVDLKQNMLDLKVYQAGKDPCNSVGAEVRSVSKYGYGTYEWIMRASSTADMPTGLGNVTSGQITSGFSFFNNSQTEIDFEIEGQNPNLVWMTNWISTSQKQSSSVPLVQPDQDFHTYKFIWKAGQIDYFIDSVKVATHTLNVPTAPAYILVNHWGTNSTNWGGLAVPNVERHVYVKLFKYTMPAIAPAPPTYLIGTVR